jgi:hypothetical protein
MQKITTVDGLKNAIISLEAEQYEKGQQLKEQVYLTIDSLRPVNLIKSAINDIFSSKDLLGNLSGTTLGVAGGFLLNKLFVGRSGNLFRKLLGSLFQFGLTNIISKNAELLKSFGQVLLTHLFQRKEN